MTYVKRRMYNIEERISVAMRAADSASLRQAQNYLES